MPAGGPGDVRLIVVISWCSLSLRLEPWGASRACASLRMRLRGGAEGGDLVSISASLEAGSWLLMGEIAPACACPTT